jgi:CHASE2 domain-containing sensor protein
MTIQGNSLIPITYEIGYITSGTYHGKTAISVILWALGTFVLMCTTILSLVSWNDLSRRGLGFVIIGIAGSCILYLASCVTQYGLLFSGPAGISVPLGILLLVIFAVFLYCYQDIFIDENANTVED